MKWEHLTAIHCLDTIAQFGFAVHKSSTTVSKFLEYDVIYYSVQ